MTDWTATVRLVIEGRVQGVWFRGWMAEKARELGIDGWVRNRYDGSVEALVSGSQDSVDAMVAACRTGPPGAFVSALRAFEAPPPGQPGFRRLPSV